ncbi:uncharacterized protein MAM_07360 [Metarhizium album ARSEF 1941]|uniref:Uncharacterized protein n=1 Tax=Metarhizium album (strain ARSEF 1941) TaxID=1081103 RepID=A0A0B2WM96_METAS|nr:uncharacterized protein MAM_07360 [Metarhizium album ARSEF 1941]KHN94764.1 hypothetical protein MAM_07360 [Metarhizium album ARSEF 1941]
MASEDDTKHMIDDATFEGGNPVDGAAWIKWNVKHGKDRTETRAIGVDHSLSGSPYIQGVTIRSAPVTLEVWVSSWPDGKPYRSIPGPTNGEHKIDLGRIGSFRFVPR